MKEMDKPLEATENFTSSRFFALVIIIMQVLFFFVIYYFYIFTSMYTHTHIISISLHIFM